MKSQTNSGFSLVEVTMALGILAFSAVVIMGLLPTGMASAQRSAHVTAGARLAAEVQSELQQVGLASFPTGDTFFDVDGRILPSATGSVYSVYRTVQTCPLPGVAGATGSTLRRVVVQVVRNPAAQTLPRDATSGLAVIPATLEERSFQFHVAAP